ncbi:hypothetical protein [Kitasatospora sp. NPDC059571]|uniref:hypothetical protein n=1 Tax=Kitasatospora sp. NPDC059571 TaxID=3346871 RepID=UPI0036746DAC
MDDLRGQLREAAEEHVPNRARMLARIERGMAQPASGRPDRPGRHREHSRVLSWPKVVLATLATAGAMTVGGLAVAAIVHSPAPQPVQSADAGPSRSSTGSPPGTRDSAAPPPGTPTAEPSRTPSTGSAAPPSTTPSTAASTATAPPVGGNHTTDGPLWSDGSVDPHSTLYWAQSNVTVKTKQALTALTVELRIALTAGVADTGHWQTPSAADFDVSVRTDGGFLVYRWTLKPGRTVPAGQHVFAGQYNHASGGRDAKADRYSADATAVDGTHASVWGDFARTG